MPTLYIPIKYSVRWLASAIIHLKEIKGEKVRKGKVKVSLFADNVVLYIKASKTPLGNLYI